MGRLDWYAQRLRVMGANEVLWRGTCSIRALAPRRNGTGNGRRVLHPGDDWDSLLRRFREGCDRPVLFDRFRAAEIERADPEGVADVLAAADRALEGRFRYFGYPEVQLGRLPNWHHDPFADYTWPMTPAVWIDHRSCDGDPKWIWELNRLQHLPWLAQAWLYTGERHYGRAALDQLASWIRCNPPGVGIAWRGAFESGVRSISVTLTLQALRDHPDLTPELFREVVLMLAAAARRCWSERSRFSSANNHLIGELAGLATIAILFPDLRSSPVWEKRAVEGLVLEAGKQIRSDGTGAEQAVGYQIFTVELLLVVTALMLRRDGGAPTGLLTAIDRSSCFLASVVGAADPDLRYGDDDEGFAMRLGASRTIGVREHLGTAAAVIRNPEVARVGRPTVAALWLGTTLPAATPFAGTRPDPHRSSGFVAADGGLVVMRSGTRRLAMDVGDLGYLALAAHGHADALALSLAFDGKDIITDPGTASYYAHSDWRRVHRGTRVHATVCVDDADQSVAGGPFLWTRHAQTRLLHADVARGLIYAEHDGYERLPGGVRHRRMLWAPPGDDRIVVVDMLAGSGRHRVRTSWPLSPAIDASPSESGFRLAHDGITVLHLAHAVSVGTILPEAVRGDNISNLGWHSRHLESREPAWLLGGRYDGELPIAIVTIMRTNGAIHAPAVQFDGRSVLVEWNDETSCRIRFDSSTGRFEFGIPIPSPTESTGRSWPTQKGVSTR